MCGGVVAAGGEAAAAAAAAAAGCCSAAAVAGGCSAAGFGGQFTIQRNTSSAEHSGCTLSRISCNKHHIIHFYTPEALTTKIKKVTRCQELDPLGHKFVTSTAGT